MRVAAVSHVILALAAIIASGACASTMAPGQVGVLRYGGRVDGTPPLDLLPPVADVEGNVYVLAGGPNVPQAQAFVGFAAGGWASRCSLTKGDQYGVHGFCGYASSEQWYWSGSALVALSGADGTCHAVLDHDPATNAELLFQAVLPWVRDLSERTTLVALVQSPTDPAPFAALVDLQSEILTDVQTFEPANAQNVVVVGVGGSRDLQLGVVLVQYGLGSSTVLEGRFYDGDANLIARAPVSGGSFSAYAVQGYLQMASSGTVVGLAQAADGTPQLIVLNRGGGTVRAVRGMTPVGVHSWEGKLWLVGTSNARPAVASIDDQGDVGAVSAWSASGALMSAVSGTVTVRDDRSLPARDTSWTDVRSAIGPFPLLSAHALTEQAPGAALWLFAGATQSGTMPTTGFALAPVGVSYP